MVGVYKGPAAADGNETGVAHFGEDHDGIRPFASARRRAWAAPGADITIAIAGASRCASVASDPPANGCQILQILLAQHVRQRPLFWLDLETVEVDNEERRNRKGGGTGQQDRQSREHQ